MSVKQIHPASRKYFSSRQFLVASAASVLLSSAIACSGSSGNTVVGPSQFAKCQLTASAAPASFSPEGGGGQLTVATERECTWSAKPGASWVSLSPPDSGQGNGSIAFTVAANPDPSSRSAVVTVNDQQVQIAQQPGVCRYQFSSTAVNIPSGGGSATVDVTASSGACEWSARSDASWIAIREGATGRGNGRVAIEAAPTTGPPRAGSVIVGDQTITVTQGSGCAFGIAPTAQTVGASGGSGTVTVTTGEGCAWTAASQTSWITITGGATGQGSGTVAFSVAATTGPTRTGTLVAAGQTLTVTQSQGCSYTIAPSNATVSHGGGTGEVNVTSDNGCQWKAESHAPWISITAGASGSGAGPVRYSASANSGPARSGTMTIAGRSFTLNQQSGCTTTIEPTSRAFEAGGGPGTVRVTSPNGCDWRATSNADWIMIRAGATGTGTGDVSFDVAPNTGAARTGTVTIRNQTFTVTQAAHVVSCNYSVNPTTQTVAATAGNASVEVIASPGCNWTAVSGADWLSITSATSGTGNGAVQLSVAANSGTARSSTITVEGAIATVNQQSGCTYSINPTSQTVAATGGNGGVDVTAPPGCIWNAVSATPAWLSITSGASGSGNGAVQFTAAPNGGPARSGTLTIAGLTATVEQPSGCSYSIAPTLQSFEAPGGTGTITVTSSDGCTWTATNGGSDWISMVSGGSGSGTGSVTFSVAQNMGAARTGTITAAGQLFTVSQSAAPAGPTIRGPALAEALIKQ